MTYLHKSRFGLMQDGFREVAAYECFEKGRRQLNIQCWYNGKYYLVRNFISGRTAWDDVYTDKDKANARVVELWGSRKYHKKVR